MSCGAKHTMRARFFGLAFLCAALLFVGACDAPREPSSLDVVRVHMSAEPASLSLLGKTDRNAEIIAVQLTDSLVQYGPGMSLEPRLAESWEFSEDRSTLTFHLRDGVRWHDGRALTARDVVFSVNKVRDPAVENLSWAPMFQDLISVESLDARTVRARYAVTTPDVMEAWRLPILPEHLAGADEDLLTGEFSRHPVGCGPFRFVRHVPDQEIVLEANDDYWDGRPSIDVLMFKIFPDQRTAYHALTSGDLDVMTVTSNLWREARDSPKVDHLETLMVQRFAAWIIGWNQDGSNPYFVDPRVRRALVLALDRQPFIDNVILGLARPGATTYHPDTAWADPQVRPWPFDPVLAGRLLDEAGWTDSDGDGVRDRQGRAFEFTMLVPASTQKLSDHIAVWQQQSWSAIGVKANIETLEWQAFRERRNSRRFAAVNYSLGFSPNPDQLELYHSDSREGGINFFGLADPEVDRLLEQGRRTFDEAERRQLYRDLQRRLHDLEPLTCLFYFTSPVMHDRRLRGIVASPMGIATTTEGPGRWRWADDVPRG